jgi:nitrate reductase assembly molybdenum cofactor insertion protein NarJ
MVEKPAAFHFYGLFAEIMEHPTTTLPGRVKECLPRIALVSLEAADLLSGFQAFLEESRPGRPQDLFAESFDLRPDCRPCAGYQLFGDSLRREIFMGLLGELYRSRDFLPGIEPADHMGVMLRFLTRRMPEEEERAIVNACLIPALEKMLERMGSGANPYRKALLAMTLLLREIGRVEADRPGAPPGPGLREELGPGKKVT